MLWVRGIAFSYVFMKVFLMYAKAYSLMVNPTGEALAILLSKVYHMTGIKLNWHSQLHRYKVFFTDMRKAFKEGTPFYPPDDIHDPRS